ncbi:hypothetical protein HQQ80_17700 [Microbacteriaceae bacterium VKM Ac-2855]|nr:hypothetical protein [Microbacteriaceae bacterium VKM Ac-2855]
MDVREAFRELGELPTRWSIGDAELEIDVALLSGGDVDRETRIIRGVSGRAWTTIPCARPRLLGPERAVRDGRGFLHAVEVVDDLVHPETQILLAAARRVRADAQLGETVTVSFDADRADLRRLLEHGAGIGDLVDADSPRSRFAVEFDDLTVDASDARLGRVTGGIARYIDERSHPVEICIEGFTLVLASIVFDPRRSTAEASVRLPDGVVDAVSCGPAMLDLGSIRLSPRCDYYIDRPDLAFGPWLVGDTGVIIEGTGCVLDLSNLRSPSPLPPPWRGLLLHAGRASGAERVPEPCNSGYLRGEYTFSDAVVIATGFAGLLELATPMGFTAINPFGQGFAMVAGALQLDRSEVAAGWFRGETELLVDAVCEGAPGNVVRVELPHVSVQPDLDLTAILDHGGREVSWGELTRHGEEAVVWRSRPTAGFLYLPAGAVATYSPVAAGPFVPVSISAGWSGSLPELEANGVSGVTFAAMGSVSVASPDVPGSALAPLELDDVVGWLRVGAAGVDGELFRFNMQLRREVGERARTGYVGVTAFDVTLFAHERQNLIAQLVTSAAYDSHISGWLHIPAPTDLMELPFEHLTFTSTGSIVGGDIVLPPGGLPLAYWDVQLVPTSPTAPAGVLSVRTGRILFTAAAIAEPEHFARPLGLTWGEMLANGALGELYLDFADWGQRFDGLVFHPAEVTLSSYIPGDPFAYLGVSGDVVFPFFGVHHVNVRDAIGDPTVMRPFPRHVTVPASAITPHGHTTELALAGTWYDVNTAELARFDCPEMQVGYNEGSQDGFIGTGGAVLSFLHSDPLATTVEIHSDATDIRFTSEQAHDLDLSVIARLGALGQIAGNLRIEGPTLRSMTVYGMFEQSVAVGIFGPKAGYEVEVNVTVTPTSFDFYAAGDMMLSLALVEIEASATVHLLFDFAAGTAEGELIGRIDCDAVVAGLSGEGQLTWFVGPTMQYLQGRLKVTVFTLVAGATLEGGFFLGNDTPRELAWVLETTDPKFGMSRALLPKKITGVYGYGRASFAVNYYVIGGGVDIFVGVGAFSGPVQTGGPLAGITGAGPLPFVVGACGINVHGEILGGLVSASAWATLAIRGPAPLYFEGTFGLRGCVAWVLCASVDISARYSDSGFELS